MARSDRSAETSETRLDTWIETMHPRLARLQDFELPRGFPFNYSRASLERLEAIVLERFDASDEVTADDGFVEAAMGYVGEALLRAGGGSWVWDDDPNSISYDLPLARPDDELDCPAASPLHLLIEAVRRSTGRELARAHLAMEQAVDGRKATDASWSPTKELTPGVDDILDVTPPEVLVDWLAEREDAFPQWVSGYSDHREIWDFSPESLDSLETLARAVVKPNDDFFDPKYRDFTEGAAWYLGEVMRRVKGGQWRYNRGEPDRYNPWVGRPYIKQRIQDGHATVPILAIKIALRRPGFLHKDLNRFQ